MNIDIISDLHIDHWDSNFHTNYICGIKKDFPFVLGNRSDILVISGDVSDNIDMTIRFIESVSDRYKEILFVEGNHEHCDRYPSLYTKKEIADRIKNKKIKYIADTYFKKNSCVFVGACGWWDYDGGEPTSVEKNKTYFKKWMPHLKEKESRLFIDSVLKKAEEEYRYLDRWLDHFEKDDSIKQVVVVTHTAPILDFVELHEKDTVLNTKFKKLIDRYKKISTWIFGHTHVQGEITLNNIRFVCHPRGRPSDYDRTDYHAKTVTL